MWCISKRKVIRKRVGKAKAVWGVGCGWVGKPRHLFSLFTARILLYPLHSQRHRLCVQSAFEVIRKGLNPTSKILQS